MGRLDRLQGERGSVLARRRRRIEGSISSRHDEARRPSRGALGDLKRRDGVPRTDLSSRHDEELLIIFLLGSARREHTPKTKR